MDKNEIKSVWAAFLEVQEGKHGKKEGMDPVGKADDDIDNDGDVDSSDKYLKNRRKAIGKAMKDDEKEESYGKMKKEGKMPPQFAKKDDDSEDEESDDKEKKGKKPEKGVNPFAKKKEDEKEDKGEVKEGKYSGKKMSKQQIQKELDKLDKAFKTMRRGGIEYDRAMDDYSELKAMLKDPHGHKKAAANPLNLNPNKTTKVKTYEAKEECPKCEGEGCDHCDGKGYHEMEKETSCGKKMKESNLFSADELAALEEKMKQPNDTGTPSEPFMSTNSAGEKKFYADHEKGSEKKYEDWEDTSEKDASNAGRAVKSQSPARRGDNLKVGDNKMETPKKG